MNLPHLEPLDATGHQPQFRFEPPLLSSQLTGIRLVRPTAHGRYLRSREIGRSDPSVLVIWLPLLSCVHGETFTLPALLVASQTLDIYHNRNALSKMQTKWAILNKPSDFDARSPKCPSCQTGFNLAGGCAVSLPLLYVTVIASAATLGFCSPLRRAMMGLQRWHKVEIVVDSSLCVRGGKCPTGLRV